MQDGARVELGRAWKREGDVDSSRGGLGKGDADVGRMRCEELGSGIEPDVAIEAHTLRERVLVPPANMVALRRGVVDATRCGARVG